MKFIVLVCKLLSGEPPDAGPDAGALDPCNTAFIEARYCTEAATIINGMNNQYYHYKAKCIRVKEY